MFFEKVFNILNVYHMFRIKRFIKKLNIEYFIDVGAHKGEFLGSILTLRFKKIYCFEPQRSIFKKLHENFKEKKKVKLFNIGLANKSSKLTIYINKFSSTSTFSKSKNTTFLRFKNFILNSKNSYIDKYQVKTKKLDEIFIQKKISNIFLKIDVEGFELNVLKGAKKILSKKVKYILVEKHFFQLFKNNSSNKVHLFLKKNNFQLIKKFTFPLFHFQDNLYFKIKTNNHSKLTRYK